MATARALIALGPILLLGCASTSSDRPVRGIHPALDKWQNQVGVEIAEFAQETLISDLQHEMGLIVEEEYRNPRSAPVEQFSVMLGGLGGRIERHSSAGDSLINTMRVDDILELYLFELRNRLVSAKGELPALIRWRDLQRIKIGYFLKGLASSRGECGWIMVRSSPSGADILVKGKSKGITLSKLVGPPGEYEVQVSYPAYDLRCTERVTVYAGQTAIVNCPELK